MAWTLVQKAANQSSGNSVSATFSGIVGNANVIVVAVANDDTALVTSVTDDKSNAYILIDSIGNPTLTQLDSLYVLGNVVNGPITITVHFSSAVASDLIIEEYSGNLPVSDPRDGNSSSNLSRVGNDGITSGFFTTTNDGDLVWGYTALSTASVGTGFTVASTTAQAMTEYKIQSLHATTVSTFTGSGGTATIGMALKPVRTMSAPITYLLNPTGQILL